MQEYIDNIKTNSNKLKGIEAAENPICSDQIISKLMDSQDGNFKEEALLSKKSKNNIKKDGKKKPADKNAFATAFAFNISIDTNVKASTEN